MSYELVYVSISSTFVSSEAPFDPEIVITTMLAKHMTMAINSNGMSYSLKQQNARILVQNVPV